MSDGVKALIAEAHGWETPAVVAQHAVSAHDTIRRLTAALEAAQQAPAVDTDSLVAEIRAAYVDYSESADFPTTKHYLEWKLLGGAEAEFDRMVAEVEARGWGKAEVFIVHDVDGTSFTGTSKIVGVALSREDAEWHAAEVKKRDSWHEGSIIAVPILRAQQVREGNE